MFLMHPLIQVLLRPGLPRLPEVLPRLLRPDPVHVPDLLRLRRGDGGEGIGGSNHVETFISGTECLPFPKLVF